MYPIKSRPECFGHAGKPGKSTAMKRQHSAKWDNSVGGMTHLVRAIYGSSDHATEDHSNSPLCRVVDSVNSTLEPRRIVRENTVTFEHVHEWTPPTVEQINKWAIRAAKLGMSLLDYAHKYSLPVAPC